MAVFDVINGLIEEEEKMKAQISKLEQEIEDMQNQTLAVEVGEL